MKHSWLLVLMLLGIIFLGAIPAGAASGAGPYYAIPAWDQTIPASTRFVVLTNFNNAAVLDRETGLVWEQYISLNTSDWASAQSVCFGTSTGNKLGWRLPTINELNTLFEKNPTTTFNTLPVGHPFSFTRLDSIWTNSTMEGNDTYAWALVMTGPTTQNQTLVKVNRLQAWCVRSQ
jgi:hypothetical protein